VNEPVRTSHDPDIARQIWNGSLDPPDWERRGVEPRARRGCAENKKGPRSRRGPFTSGAPECCRLALALTTTTAVGSSPKKGSRGRAPLSFATQTGPSLAGHASFPGMPTLLAETVLAGLQIAPDAEPYGAETVSTSPPARPLATVAESSVALPPVIREKVLPNPHAPAQSGSLPQCPDCRTSMCFAVSIARVTEPGRVQVFECATCKKLDFLPET
jgi:hypothetical protein